MRLSLYYSTIQISTTMMHWGSQVSVPGEPYPISNYILPRAFVGSSANGMDCHEAILCQQDGPPPSFLSFSLPAMLLHPISHIISNTIKHTSFKPAGHSTYLQVLPPTRQLLISNECPYVAKNSGAGAAASLLPFFSAGMLPTPYPACLLCNGRYHRL